LSYLKSEASLLNRNEIDTRLQGKTGQTRLHSRIVSIERLCSKWLLQVLSGRIPSCKYGRKLRKTAQPIIEANVPHCNFIKLDRCRHCIGAAKMRSISPGPELPETVFGSGKRQSMPILGKKP